MARIENPLGITGTFGGISIYKMNGKFYARVKGGPKREDIKKSPKMVKIREKNEEFGKRESSQNTSSGCHQVYVWSFRSDVEWQTYSGYAEDH